MRNISRLRKIYFLRFIGRCVTFLLYLWLYLTDKSVFSVLERGQFFKTFSPLHLMWIIWMTDMILQLVPAKHDLALGSKKLFRQYFQPSNLKKSAAQLKRYLVTTSKLADGILLIWIALIALIGVCHRAGWFGDAELFMISVAMYVCDLICVLFWCPFRLMLKNRCCTTCRIFNWDHMMMLTPMIYVGSFYTVSLLIVALIVWIVWEVTILIHPERFWWGSNSALTCANCTDKLCTQYCEKHKR